MRICLRRASYAFTGELTKGSWGSFAVWLLGLLEEKVVQTNIFLLASH